ncbi:hypothetical protein KGO95_01555 [Patescibacteria group bacterium]|nr:hypothetical protein [Patescibacteria group bacterium]
MRTHTKTGSFAAHHRLAWFSAILLPTAYCLLALTANAQTAPEFMVSWKALDYVPADYIGKTLPTQTTQVEAAFDVIDQGKIVDVSKNMINWYDNNALIAAGIGLKTFKLTPSSTQSDTIRIAVSNYNANGDISTSFLVPIVKPEVAVSVPTPTANLYRNRTALAPQPYLLEARPFFFNATSLSGLTFSWQVNNTSPTGNPGNPNFLTLDLSSQGTPQETDITLSAGVTNTGNQLELGSRMLNLIVQ